MKRKVVASMLINVLICKAIHCALLRRFSLCPSSLWMNLFLILTSTHLSCLCFGQIPFWTRYFQDFLLHLCSGEQSPNMPKFSSSALLLGFWNFWEFWNYLSLLPNWDWFRKFPWFCFILLNFEQSSGNDTSTAFLSLVSSAPCFLLLISISTWIKHSVLFFFPIPSTYKETRNICFWCSQNSQFSAFWCPASS